MEAKIWMTQLSIINVDENNGIGNYGDDGGNNDGDNNGDELQSQNCK